MGKDRTTGRRWLWPALLSVVAVVIVALACASVYMLDYSLSNPGGERPASRHIVAYVKERCPWTTGWIDSVYTTKAVRDTFVVMPTGDRLHAIYLRAPRPTNRTAIVVHGYKMRAEGMLHIAYLYNKDLEWNVLLPDLHAHGQSEGDDIQMGWKDRQDVMRWSEVADELFRDSAGGHSVQVMHGISMGAATVMAVSGEETPDYVRAFVEDCGYTGVWDELSTQLKAQFSLPAFPLMYLASGLCKARYGWSFGEARQIDQVAKCRKPMLFIHGTDDDFVPTWMVHPLYKAKQGEKQLYMAKGSAHANAYCDHHEEYTEKVRAFLELEVRN